MILTGENQGTQVTNFQSATLFANSFTWNDTRSKQNLCFEKSATKFLGHDRVCSKNLKSVPPSDTPTLFVKSLVF